MAEEMLKEEYRSSHVMSYEDLTASFDMANGRSDTKTNNNSNKNDDEDSGDKKPAPSSAMKTTRDKNERKRNSNNDTNKGSAATPTSQQSRSVQIQVPPKPKRQKTSPRKSAVDIVQALNRAVSTEERIDALETAIATFDHDDRNKHDYEISVGADIALVKTLVFLEFKSQFRREPIKADMEEITHQIGLTLTALEAVYRASSESVGESFSRVGVDLMHILVILIDDEVNKRYELGYRNTSPESFPASSRQDDQADNDGDGNQSIGDNDSVEGEQKRPVTPPSPHHRQLAENSQDHEIMLRKATKCLGHFARVGDATKPLAHFPGFLGSTLNLINLRPYPLVPFEARLSCLWTIGNLACHTANMRMMVSTPNLLNSLVSISCRSPEAGDSLETIMEILRAKSIASRAILNLSYSPENKVLMCENFALVDTLSNLAMERRAPYRKSHTMQDIMVQTRRNSIGALRNMAAAPRRSKILLCQYNNGKLLDVMTDVALNEMDQHTVDLAFAAIHNLAIHDTAEAIVERPALVLALKNVLLEDDNSNDGEDTKNSRKSNASSTILVLERSITPELPSYENLRELLDAINPSNPTDEDGDEDSDINATAV
jgi:hypothetical protein